VVDVERIPLNLADKKGGIEMAMTAHIDKNATAPDEIILEVELLEEMFAPTPSIPIPPPL
jgi:hypothetical protein